MYVAKKYSFMLAWTWLCQIDACVSHSIAEVKLVVSGDLKHHVFWCSSYCVKNLSPPMAMHEHRYSKIRNLIQLLLVRRVPDKFRRQLLCFLQTEVTACYSVSGSMAVFFLKGSTSTAQQFLYETIACHDPRCPAVLGLFWNFSVNQMVYKYFTRILLWKFAITCVPLKSSLIPICHEERCGAWGGGGTSSRQRAARDGEVDQ